MAKLQIIKIEVDIGIARDNLKLKVIELFFLNSFFFILIFDPGLLELNP